MDEAAIVVGVGIGRVKVQALVPVRQGAGGVVHHAGEGALEIGVGVGVSLGHRTVEVGDGGVEQRVRVALLLAQLPLGEAAAVVDVCAVVAHLE